MVGVALAAGITNGRVGGMRRSARREKSDEWQGLSGNAGFNSSKRKAGRGRGKGKGCSYLLRSLLQV